MHFLSLIRPLNLLIVAATMYGTGWYFEGIYGLQTGHILLGKSFSLLVISTLMIAAAGNIINDYFDVRADRINKPHRVVIGKFVKRRVAIVSHWGLNFVAFGIAVYLSWTLDTFWYLFIHLLSINILWFYSTYLKRQFLSGNLAIAALTGMVPVLTGLFFHQYAIRNPEVQLQSQLPFDQYEGPFYVLWISFGLATFAFILNLAREIVKDMEDVEGDLKLSAKTLPIVLGYKKSKWIAAGVLSCAVISSLLVWNYYNSISLLHMLPILCSAALVMLCFGLLSGAREIKHYRRINHLIKLAMVCGLCSPVYWHFMMIYG